MSASNRPSDSANTGFQQAHWAVPNNILGVLPYIYISHTRLAAFLLPKFYSTVRPCGRYVRTLLMRHIEPMQDCMYVGRVEPMSSTHG